MTPEKRTGTAVRDAQLVLSAYVEPGFRHLERTINELLNVLDDYQLIEAQEEIENGHEQGAAKPKPDKPDRGRSEVLDTAP